MQKLERKNKGMLLRIFEKPKYSGSQDFRGVIESIEMFLGHD